MKVSVIIPAFNAEKAIGNCLSALRNQSFSDAFEIIVVDDGSKDNTCVVVNGFRGVLLHKQSNAGPAVARNQGAHLASGRILVFTDSDCIPSKNWLEEMIKPFQDPEVVAVQGAYITQQRGIVPRFCQAEIEERYERMKKKDRVDFIGSYSAAYQKDVFFQAGGFDEQFRTASGEDSDLSYRLSKTGKMVFNPKAIVLHRHPQSILKYWQTKFFRAFWRYRMYWKNPEKIGGDSYTNPLLKFQIAALFGALLGAVFSFLFPFFSGGFFLISNVLVVLTIILVLPISFFIFKRDWVLGAVSVPILIGNVFLYGTGLVAGWIWLGATK